MVNTGKVAWMRGERAMTENEAKRYYTVEEANKTLPLVKAIVGDIVAKYQAIRERRQRLDRIRRSKKVRDSATDVYEEELLEIEADLDRELTELDGFVSELTSLGIELKDPEVGLIDFRALMDGREVYLCWLMGEDEISHWHELDAGFQGRQSLLAETAPVRSRAGRKPRGNASGEGGVPKPAD